MRRSSCALLLCFHWMKFPVNSTGQNVHVRLRPFRFEMPAWETVSVSRASVQHQHLPPDSLPGTPDRTRKLHLQSSYHTLCQTSNTLLHLPDLLRRNPIFMKSPGTNNSPVQFSGNFLRHPSADHLILMPRKIQNRRSRTHRTIP